MDRMNSTEILIDLPGITVSRSGSDILVVRVPRRSTTALFRGPVLIVVAVAAIAEAVFGLMLTAELLPLIKSLPTGKLMLISGALFCLVAGTMAMFALETLFVFHCSFERVLEFDMRQGSLRVTHLPFCTRVYRLTQVETVDLCSGQITFSPMNWLCLSVHGRTHGLIVQSTTLDSARGAGLLAGLTSTAELISEFLKIPIRRLNGQRVYYTTFLIP